MSFSIYTYSNPYEINGEPYWDSIKNCAQFCVSQTMVNGMTSSYDELCAGKLSTVENLVSSFFEEWEDNERYIQQYATIDNIIKTVEIKDKQNATKIKAALGFNKKRIVDSIRIMCELGIDINEINISALTQEQKYLVGIYNEILKSDAIKIFSLQDNFNEMEVEAAIIKGLIKEKEDYPVSTVDIDTVIFHGIHQFTPIILKVIDIVEKYKRVVLLFNYQQQYKNIYQTWIDVYSAFDIPIKSQFSNEFRPSPLIANSYKGNLLADKMANLIEGNISKDAIKKDDYEILEFDNVTEFAGYVASEFEQAEIEQEKDENNKKSTLYYMKEQFYSANSDVNNILKVYFPEQFGERHFLAYPIGHFFVSVTNMWNANEGGIAIKDLNDIIECLSAGIIEEKILGELVSTFNKVRIFISRAVSIDEMISLLKKLKKRKKNSGCELLEKEKIDRLYYFDASIDEIDSLIIALEQLNSITTLFYEDFEENNNFKNFYIKIREFLETRVLEAEDLDDEFKDVLVRLLTRLEKADSIEVNGSFQCLKDTMSFYLKQESKKGQSANWIVRDFEQIDGDILKSRWQKKDTTYHFACLSDSDMNVTRNDRFPWPLDVDFFELAHNPIDWKYQVYIKSRREYKNFKRYALVYGLQFNRVKFKISYIKNDDEKENEMYYLFKILGIRKKQNVLKDNEISLKDSNEIKLLKKNSKGFNQTDLYKYRICKFRFALESIVEGGTKYKDRFLLLKYFEVLLENEVRIKLQGQPANETLLMQALYDEYDNFQRKFEFAIELDQMDIITNARNFLKNEILKSSKVFPAVSDDDRKYMKKKEDFIYLKISSKDNTEENVFRGKFGEASQMVIDNTFNNAILASSKYEKACNEWCQYCAVREICLESYKIISD